ncbi:MAG: O-antigen ligase family protein [Oscillospiraceae bacterium]|nr:O-antigen ligase family protein [Oscillospiraceae bacterium]
MAKTIFNTSENSNFILNLTKEKYSKMASFSLVLTCILISVSVIPCELNIDKISYPIISGALSLCGVICMIMSIIAFIKGYIENKKLIPILFFGAMLLWGVISLINSYDKNVSLYGFDGRGEGLLALIFYFCFFVTASAISGDKFKIIVFDSVVAMGIINSLWAVPQIFIDSMPSKYNYIVSAGDVNASSGLSQSPLFLAMVLSIALAISLLGSLILDGKNRKIIYFISSLLFAFVMIFTYSLISLVGISFAVITAFMIVFTKKMNIKNICKPWGIIISSVIAVLLINSGIVCENSKYSLHDGALMWFDSFNRLGSSGNYNPEKFDIENTADVYLYINSKTIDIIKKYPITGTGEENLIYPQLHSSYNVIENNDTFDKNYNEYLYIAGTRGIPSLLFFIIIICLVMYTGIKKLKADKNNSLNYISFVGVLCGIIIFLIGAGNINFSPLFWIFAGFLISSDDTSEQIKIRNK